MSSRELKGSDAFERVDYERKKRSTIEGIASCARDGDKECAVDMIGVCSVEVERSNIPQPVKSYLLDCLCRVEGGETPDQAFGFTKGSAGRTRSYWKLARDRDVACAVAYTLEQDETLSIERACEIVSGTYNAFSDKVGVLGADGVKKTYLQFFPKSGK
ncbi:MAG: hypothetical protein K9L70_07905 [Thiohalocapsa sp.]|nr:hypothetical protein [Thiohalocapsa sp.]MCF7991583.1 hypothetical protein [Thiohalocapsa sp.]